MRYLAGLSLAAALILAAAEARAFTFQDQGATTNSPSANITTNSAPATGGAKQRNYGSTLTTPGQPWALGEAIKSTPSTDSAAAAGGQSQGFSYRLGPTSSGFGSQTQRPPAWSTNPLYLDRGQ